MTRRDFPQKLNGPWIMPDDHYRKDNAIAYAFGAVVFIIMLTVLGYFFAAAWVEEDINRVEHLRIHKQQIVERGVR
jgi:hypothetical protein